MMIMSAFLLCALLAASPIAGLQKDAYGVPLIRAESAEAAFELAGRAIAEDRLWQIEMSRHVARGRSAEILGAAGVKSDTEIFRTGYTDTELNAMFDALPNKVKRCWEAYAKGINATLTYRRRTGTLPREYKRYSLTPEPWTVLDSAAIGVMMTRRFGNGGAGELRNYAISLYLQGKVGPKWFDVLQDFSWQNEPDAPVTVSRAEDPLVKTPFPFADPSDAESLAHFSKLPKSSVLELMPAITLASNESVVQVAQSNSVPYKSGSYAVVISPSKSTSRNALLLGAPQMGHTKPSIVYEIAIRCPEFSVNGLSVPGVPGILVGTTPKFGWTLTSGIADMSDIFVMPRIDGTTYRWGDEKMPLKFDERQLTVRDAANPVNVRRTMSHIGPVILESGTGQAIYVQRSAFWGKELEGYSNMFELYSARNQKEMDAAITKFPVSFNFFYAWNSGQIGWRYCGHIPVRAPRLDPRFPTPGSPENDWKGVISPSKMPYVHNPKSGVIVNWNNKPVQWWNNGDTPLWGKVFRVQALQQAIDRNMVDGRISADGLLNAAKMIARSDDQTVDTFLPLLINATTDWVSSATGEEKVLAEKVLAVARSASPIREEGTAFPLLSDEFTLALREELFLKTTGNFFNPQAFNLVAQPSVMQYVLRERTRYDYFEGRTAKQVALNALRTAVQRIIQRQPVEPSKWQWRPGFIRYDDAISVPFSNRGTYIQLFESGRKSRSRTILGPGQAETGPNSLDQVPYVRDWELKSTWPH